jgi:glucan phosphoethanolaminetransferase (alkaline phosphatase superfamily)
MAKNSEKPGKIGFYFFGLGEIFIGLLFTLLSLVMFAIPKLAPPNPQGPVPNIWPIALMELTFSSFIIALGVGTIMAKRWARKIMLILSWYGLCAGLFALLFFIFFMGSFWDNAFNSAPNLTPAAISGLKIGMLVMIGVFYVLLPGIFVLFYKS